MDENNFTKENINSDCLHHGDDELENWTFVSSEDSPLEKNGGVEVNHEDLSDNHSEQGSDSGSSIVVIDTTYASFQQDLSQNGDCSDSDQVDMVTENIKDPEVAETNDQVEEFSKEQSPFLFIENSTSLGKPEEYSQSNTDTPTVVMSSIPDSISVIDESAAIAVDNEADNFSLTNPGQQFISVHEQAAEETAAEDKLETEIHVNEDTDGKQTVHAKMCGSEDNMSNTTPVQPANEDQTVGAEQGMQQLLESVSSAGDLDEAVNLDESEFLNDDEAEETDEENWDLGVEAPAYSASLASSVSSLIEQPGSPPFLIVEQGHSANLVKPDLLEEANKIEELDQFDYSSVTNPDLPPELNVGAILRERAYVHRPNQRLNVQLSYVVAFALAAVFGFAVGNLVGLADNFPSRCTPVNGKSQAVLNTSGWTEEQWNAEVQRLAAINEELKMAAARTAEELSDLSTQNSHFDLRINELISENWDLKQSIGRLRYGKPARSVEDRHTINILHTENQELRNTVGKLRYKCGQEHSTVVEQPLDKQNDKILAPEVQELSRSLLELLGSMNRTTEWNKFVESSEENFTIEKLSKLKDTATDLVELISLRRENLGNFTDENNMRSVEKMRASLLKSASKVFNVMERLHHQENALNSVIDEEQMRIQKIKAKFENHWKSFLNPDSCTNENCSIGVKGASFDTEWSTSVEQTTQGYHKTANKKDWPLDKKVNFHDNNFSKDRESSVDSEWFLIMGKSREKFRHDEARSEWLFERAKNRDTERKYRTRKYQQKGKKPKFSKDGAWKHYSA